MAFYESIFILGSSLSEDESTAIMEKMKGALEGYGASIIKAENWGKKKLAYEVAHDRRGTFILLQFEAGGKVISELERLYRLEDSILKFLTVRVEEEELKSAVTANVESESGGV